MKTLRTLLSIYIYILLIGCSDDDNRIEETKYVFSASELKQTEWKGEILYLTNGKVGTRGTINIIFYTESSGLCEYKLDYHIDPEITSFKYEISDKLMFIQGPAAIYGNWILQKYDGDSLVIADGTSAFTNSEIMKLKRVN